MPKKASPLRTISAAVTSIDSASFIYAGCSASKYVKARPYDTCSYHYRTSPLSMSTPNTSIQKDYGITDNFGSIIVAISMCSSCRYEKIFRLIVHSTSYIFFHSHRGRDRCGRPSPALRGAQALPRRAPAPPKMPCARSHGGNSCVRNCSRSSSTVMVPLASASRIRGPMLAVCRCVKSCGIKAESSAGVCPRLENRRA